MMKENFFTLKKDIPGFMDLQFDLDKVMYKTARIKFQYVAKMLRKMTEYPNINVMHVNDLINLYDFNIVVGYGDDSYQLLTPKEQREILNATVTPELNELLANLANDILSVNYP